MCHGFNKLKEVYHNLNVPALKYLRPHRCTRGWNQITHQCYYHGYRYCTEQCINEIKSQKVIQLVIFSVFFLPWSLHLIVRSWKRTCSMKHKSEYNIYSAISLFVINELFIVRFFKTKFDEEIYMRASYWMTWKHGHFRGHTHVYCFPKQFLHFAWSTWICFQLKYLTVRTNKKMAYDTLQILILKFLVVITKFSKWNR